MGSRPQTIGRRTNRGIDAPDNPFGGFRRQRRRGPGACPGFVPIFILERELESRRWRRASRVSVPGAAPRSPAVGSSLATWLGRGSPESAPRGPGSSGWWLGSAGITLVMAVCGAICVAARKYWPQESAGSVRVVGRVSLSSRHSIFLVRAGERVLLIGTGSQGAPSLLGELTEAERALDSADPARRRPYSPDARTARPFEVTSTRATPSLDIHLGDDQ